LRGISDSSCVISTALQLEASRGMGADPFGRSSSEVAIEITQLESEMPRKAFYQPIITI
jgi:hypothetical protein